MRFEGPPLCVLERTVPYCTITVRVAVEEWPEASVPVKVSAVCPTAAPGLIFNLKVTVPPDTVCGDPGLTLIPSADASGGVTTTSPEKPPVRFIKTWTFAALPRSTVIGD